MARLKDIMPPGEIVRWRSQKVVQLRRLLGWGAAYLAFAAVILLLYSRLVTEDVFYTGISVAVLGLLWLGAKLSSTASEVAVTEGHLVWVGAAPLYAGNRGIQRLRDIRAVDLEDGEALVNLYCDGGNTTFELPRSADPEAMARAIGRPARIWRKSTSRVARRAWRWQEYSAAIAVAAAVALVGGMFGLVYLLLGADAAGGGMGGKVVGLIVVVSAAISVGWAAEIGYHTLPHFLVGRWLSGEDRRDFVGALTDPRWQGLSPTGRNDGWPPRPRLTGWAMRTAYGDIPDLSAYGPEVVVSGDFPEGV